MAASDSRDSGSQHSESSESDPGSPPYGLPSHGPRVSRRKVLVSVGGSLVVLVVGGTVWRSADQGVFSTGQGPAYQPWYDWRSAIGRPVDLIRAAILAANPHDSQPWLFHDTDTHIDLFADTRRNIGLADPFLSELHIGLGCALENLVLAAPANGYAPRVTLFPDAMDATKIATVDLQPSASSASALYQAIPHRHTNRYPYDTHHPVGQTTVDALSALNTDPQVQVLWVAAATAGQQLGKLMVEAAHAFVADKPLVQDDDRWYRATWQDVQRYRDGITLDAAGLPDLPPRLGQDLAARLPCAAT